MIHVDVNFLCNSKNMLATALMKENDTIFTLKEKLCLKIEVFKEKEVVIVYKSENGIHSIPPDTKQIGEFLSKSNAKISFTAFPRITVCNVKTSNTYEQREIDVTTKVFDFVYNIIELILGV